jgi:hypothetical protein
MKITAIVCTYNRCDSLDNALAGVAASIVPQSAEWEVLVVEIRRGATDPYKMIHTNKLDGNL